MKTDDQISTISDENKINNTFADSLVICGRVFSSNDFLQINQIIKEKFDTSRANISREVCQALNWFKPNGGLKEMSCRVAMLKMHREGIITLPPPRRSHGNCRRKIAFTSVTDPKPLIEKDINAFLPLSVERVVNREESYLWNELIERYHYLGYTPLPGSQLRYIVKSAQGIVGVIGFSAAAWKIKDRDKWIGWTEEERKRNLHLIVNNSRFLILPWIKSKNLASKMLAISVKQMIIDWKRVYGYEPVLLETFVEKETYKGTCYKAANWQLVGETQGRGKLDSFRKNKLPIKDIYCFIINKNFQESLRTIDYSEGYLIEEYLYS